MSFRNQLYRCPQQRPVNLLSSRSGFGRSFLPVTLIEAIYASRRIDQLLFAGKKRMARRAYFHMQVTVLGRTRLKSLAAGAGYGYLAICWMNLWFHCSLTLTIDS